MSLDPILQFLVVASLKTACILLVTFGGLWLMRQASASLRHWLLNISMIAALVLPVFTWLMPSWSLAILPQTPTASVIPINPSKPFDPIEKIKREKAAAVMPVAPS